MDGPGWRLWLPRSLDWCGPSTLVSGVTFMTLTEKFTCPYCKFQHSIRIRVDLYVCKVTCTKCGELFIAVDSLNRCIGCRDNINCIQRYITICDESHITYGWPLYRMDLSSLRWTCLYSSWLEVVCWGWRRPMFTSSMYKISNLWEQILCRSESPYLSLLSSPL